MDFLFENMPSPNWRKEKALKMVVEGYSHAEICQELQVSYKTLTAWLKCGLPKGDPDLDQVSLVDGLSGRERQTQN